MINISKIFLLTSANSSSSSLILLVAMFGIFYFFIIRPQKKREKEVKNMRSSLKKGDEIITIGGIMGKIIKLSDDTMVIETSPGKQRLEMAKWSVQTVVNDIDEKIDSKKIEIISKNEEDEI